MTLNVPNIPMYVLTMCVCRGGGPTKTCQSDI